MLLANRSSASMDVFCGRCIAAALRSFDTRKSFEPVATFPFQLRNVSAMLER
jgi:hypothetical protein